MKVSIKDVAAKAGVSIATVSHVLNNTKKVSPGTMERVMVAIKELNYQANQHAIGLKAEKSSIVAFIVADLTNQFFAEVAQGIEDVLDTEGYDLMLMNANERLSMEEKKVSAVTGMPVAGLIISPTTNNHEYLKLRIGDSYPLVFIDRKPAGMEGDCILSDNKKGAYEAIQYLINKGHSKIGIISGLPSLTTSVEREEGYLAALKDNGIEPNPLYMRNGDGRKWSGYQLMQDIYSSTDISAVFITNNSMMMGAFAFLKENNVEIPSRIAMLGFDDADWTPITTPPVTVIKQRGYEIGHEAAMLLIRRMEGHAVAFHKVQEIRVSTSLVIRASC